MTLVHPNRWPLALTVYCLCGLAAGLGWPQALAIRAGLKAGIGTAFTVNIFLPACAVAIALAYPRLRTAIVGGVLLTAGMVFATLLRIEPRLWTWTSAIVRAGTHPIQLAATLAYILVGVVTVGVCFRFRQVALADWKQRCVCGYLVAGLPAPRCPECGRELETYA